MQRLIQSVFVSLFTLLVAACSTTPAIEEMEQLDGAEIQSLLAGNTFTARYDWGVWYQAYNDDLTGNARASGNGWSETASSTTTVSADGELCAVYVGDNEWSTEEHRYCDHIFRDTEGNLYTKVTVHTRRPERVGKVRGFRILEGDPKGLNQQG